MSARPSAGAGLVLLLLWWLGVTTGCALVTGVPAGPIAGPGARVGGAYAFAYAPATAQTVQPSGEPYTLRRNSAMYWGLVPLWPLRAMLRLSPGTFMDVGADIGWMDLGLQLRAGQLDARRQWPWGIELEWRTGQRSLFQDDVPRSVRIYQARAELYPRLGSWIGRDTFGVLTAGVSTGTRAHSMFPPGEFDVTMEGPGGAGFLVARHETRLELSAGAQARDQRAAISVALQPWIALHPGRVLQSACDGCTLSLSSLDAGWGVALVATFQVIWEDEQRDSVP
jgi:hypothetical protein